MINSFNTIVGSGWQENNHHGKQFFAEKEKLILKKISNKIVFVTINFSKKVVF